MELRFFPINIFRETPKVTFFDAGLDSSNGSDVVIHSGEAISPPDDLKDDHLNLFEYADTASEAWEIIKSSKISDYK